jgi:Holliday junction resolvase RusA-like endonuclease
VTKTLTKPPAVEFFVPGQPAAWPRPVKSKSGHIYPNRSADPWGHQVRASAIERIPADAAAQWPRDGAFHVAIGFAFVRPQSHYANKPYQVPRRLKDSAPVSMLKRPDVDNLTKMVLDALGAWNDLPPLLWFDDAQVVWIQARKHWASAACARVRVWWYPQ